MNGLFCRKGWPFYLPADIYSNELYNFPYGKPSTLKTTRIIRHIRDLLQVPRLGIRWKLNNAIGWHCCNAKQLKTIIINIFRVSCKLCSQGEISDYPTFWKSSIKLCNDFSCPSQLRRVRKVHVLQELEVISLNTRCCLKCKVSFRSWFRCYRPNALVFTLPEIVYGYVLHCCWNI